MPEESKKVVEEKIRISITKREKEQVTEPAAKGITISFLNWIFYNVSYKIKVAVFCFISLSRVFEINHEENVR